MIDEKEISRHISYISSSKGFNAIIKVLDDYIESATQATTDERVVLHHGAIAHAAGGLSWLRDYRHKLISLSTPSQSEPPSNRLE